MSLDNEKSKVGNDNLSLQSSSTLSSISSSLITASIPSTLPQNNNQNDGQVGEIDKKEITDQMDCKKVLIYLYRLLRIISQNETFQSDKIEKLKDQVKRSIKGKANSSTSHNQITKPKEQIENPNRNKRKWKGEKTEESYGWNDIVDQVQNSLQKAHQSRNSQKRKRKEGKKASLKERTREKEREIKTQSLKETKEKSDKNKHFFESIKQSQKNKKYLTDLEKGKIAKSMADKVLIDKIINISKTRKSFKAIDANDPSADNEIAIATGLSNENDNNDGISLSVEEMKLYKKLAKEANSLKRRKNNNKRIFENREPNID